MFCYVELIAVSLLAIGCLAMSEIFCFPRGFKIAEDYCSMIVDCGIYLSLVSCMFTVTQCLQATGCDCHLGIPPGSTWFPRISGFAIQGLEFLKKT